MENAIVKEDKIEKDFKQIYPNNREKTFRRKSKKRRS